MNKRVLTLLLAASMAAGMCGCGDAKKDTAGTEVVSTEMGSAVDPYVYDTPASSTFSYVPAEQIKTLASYKNLTTTLSSVYEITDENMDSYLQQVLTYYGAESMVEIPDQEIVGENDWVKVDYTGYLNGEAFEGGAATDQVISVSGNCSSTGSGFIPGFTDCLAGAKVGEEISGDVTFPESYGNEDLAGKETTFTFLVKAVMQPVTFEGLTDKMVASGIGATLGFETVADLKTAVTMAMERELADAKTAAAEEILLSGSEVEVPEDYLAARTNEYIAMLAKNYCSEGQTFEEYLSANGTSMEEQYSNFEESTRTTIQLEWILGRIAELENYEFDEELYKEGITALIEQNSIYSNEEELYTFFGNGNQTAGEKYMRDQYMVSLAMTRLAEEMQVNFEY